MKKTLLLVAMFAFAIANICAQTQLTIGALANDTIIIGSGADYVLISEIDDQDAGIDQAITFTATSDNDAIIEVTSVDYTAGNTFAVINVLEKGSYGSVTINITADDGDGVVNTSIDVVVDPYNRPGLNYQIFDIVFWQEMNPFGLNSVFDTIVPIAEAPDINWDNIPLTVSSDCSSEWCDGHDFSTTLISGYIVPETTGDYTFYQTHQSDNALWLSTDANYDNVSAIIYRGDNDSVGAPGTGDEMISAPVTLTAGQAYAFYSAQWNIHFEPVNISWEGPGITKQTLGGQYVMNNYDTEKPVLVSDIKLFKTGVTDLLFTWDEASDNNNVTGYNVYVDGIKYNTELVDSNSILITGLTADTKYSVAINAVDYMGNESAISNIVTDNTYPVDAVVPPAPTNIVLTKATGLAVQVSWTPTIDGETVVNSYDVYLDGVFYANVYDTTIIIKDLDPSTSYDVTVVAIDAAYNESTPSGIFVASTTKFEVGDNLGVINGKLTIKMENISWNEGAGLNIPELRNDSKWTLDDTLKTLIREFEPGSIRLMWDWSLAGRCDDYVAPGLLTADTLLYNIGDFMHLANENGAYTMLTVSLQDDAVFMQDPQNYANLLEYYCGSTSTTWGAERANNGYIDPLIDSCPGFVIEYGNEVWGGTGHCIPLGDNYDNYAQYCRDMDTIIKSSPYYDPTKMFTCYSGRNPDPVNSYGLNDKLFKGDNKQVDWVALSGYMGGNFDYDVSVDPGKSELDYLKNAIGLGVSNIKGLYETKKDMLELSGEIKPIWFYEGNITTTYYFARFGQAIIYADYVASAMEEGVFPSMFSLYSGQWRMIDPSQNFKKLPIYNTIAAMNHHCKGHILKTEFETTDTIRDANGNAIDADPVGTYAYTKDDKMSILLISRDFENDAYVQIDIPDTLTFNSSVTKYTYTSDNYSSYDTYIDTSTITLSDSMMVRVPKYGMVLLVLDGIVQDLTPLPLAAYTGFKQASNVEMTCAQGTPEITSNFGFISFSAEVTPADAFVTSVMWELVDNDINATLTVYSGGAIVMGTGLCDGNGTVTIRAYSPTNETVYDEMIVTVSNQGINCESAITENYSNSDIAVYPNPASHFITVQSNKLLNASCQIVNLSGQILLKEDINANKAEINIEGLQSGIYFIQVTSGTKQETFKFVKE